MRQLFQLNDDLTGNLPPMPAICPDAMAPVIVAHGKGHTNDAVGISATASVDGNSGCWLMLWFRCGPASLGNHMRTIILAAIAAAAVALGGAMPAQAVGSRYPFCLQGDEFPGLSNCTFTSYRQCQATASGRFLTCIENPFFNGGVDPRASRRRGPAVYGDRY